MRAKSLAFLLRPHLGSWPQRRSYFFAGAFVATALPPSCTPRATPASPILTNPSRRPAFPPDRSHVLDPCAAQDLRCLCRDGLARRARGAGKNCPTVRRRGRHSRAQSGRAPGSSAAALGTDSGRPEGLPRSAADQDQRQERAQRRYSLRDLALGRSHPLRRRTTRNDQQRRRTRHPPAGPGAQELSLCRLRRRRPPSRYHVHIIETARLNHVDPEAWLAHVIACIADHPINRVDPAALAGLRSKVSPRQSLVSLRGHPIALDDHSGARKNPAEVGFRSAAITESSRARRRNSRVSCFRRRDRPRPVRRRRRKPARLPTGAYRD